MAWTRRSPELYYDYRPGNPLLVFLHEIGGSVISWDGVLAALPPGYGRMLIDQRGFGRSEKPRHPYGIADIVDDLENVLVEAGVEGEIGFVAAAGASAVAALFAARYPARVAGMVLCCPALVIDPGSRAQAIDRAGRVAAEGMAAVTDDAMTRIYPASLREMEYDAYRSRFLANDPVGFALANTALANFDMELGEIAAPVLLLAGDQDIRPVESVEVLAQRFQRASTVAIARSGHIMAVQQPAQVAQHVVSFFNAIVAHDGQGENHAAALPSPKWTTGKEAE